MIIDTVSPTNRGVLKYLGRGKKSQNTVLAAPDSVTDPYLRQGSHPDIVYRVWDELGASLPIECRCLIYGTPSLVQDRTGVVIAICNGTQYNLRLTPDDFRHAISKGASTRTRWSRTVRKCIRLKNWASIGSSEDGSKRKASGVVIHTINMETLTRACIGLPINPAPADAGRYVQVNE